MYKKSRSFIFFLKKLFSIFSHFVREVLDTIAPPYSAEFVQVIFRFDPIVKAILKVVVSHRFIDQALHFFRRRRRLTFNIFWKIDLGLVFIGLTITFIIVYVLTCFF